MVTESTHYLSYYSLPPTSEKAFSGFLKEGLWEGFCLLTAGGWHLRGAGSPLAFLDASGIDTKLVQLDWARVGVA
ncbi:hypothetical protein B296_00014183 [Ensete ventricosum]|uniref:Uncharacterized protein n=1 Tax=Ensete ventricosum TaxID=4639 RepID=A0A427AEL7_ENSVE|nr:hypothetical protein B296_00014183 [Ensete ventricosum]